MAATEHADAAKKSVTDVQDFEEVRKREQEYIRLRQQGTPAGLQEGDASERLIGLAFSGGGIRSATTNLGVLQALSRMGILRLVDYLSTVSGGGYIGGCLSTLLSVKSSALYPERDMKDSQAFEYGSRRQLAFTTEWGQFPFNPEREADMQAAAGVTIKPSPAEKIVAHLRTHGDFLIARRSIFKREALRAVGMLVGGVLYTVLLTVLTLAVISLLLLGAAHGLSRDIARWNTTEGRYKVEDPLAQTELRFTRGGATEPETRVREATDAGLSAHLQHRVQLIWDDMTQNIRAREILTAAGAGAVVTMIVLLAFILAMRFWRGRFALKPGENRDDAVESPLLRRAAGLLWATVFIVPFVNAQLADNRTSAAWLLQPFVVMAGAYLAAFLLYSFVFAFTPLRVLEPLWSRRARSLWGSYLAITLYGMLVTLLFALLPAASYAAHAVGLKGVLAPIGSLIVGRVLMTRAVAGTAERFELSKTALHVLLGIVVAALIGFTMIEVGALAIERGFVDPLAADGWWPYAIAVAIALVALAILCVTVNLNRIGLHFFYRDRILETYLRSEVDDPSTGGMTPFVSAMEMKLRDVHGNGPTEPGGLGNTAPYLLVSAALNLAGSRDLTRKDRKSGYFLFSKFFCGSRQTGYRDTKLYLEGRTQLARALTVSGAAAGTGMGYQTFFAQSFLTAVFNIRLGQWISNPKTNSSERFVFWPTYMLREALGATNERTRLVNVSDGGHTGDNVGIYPLFERRCKVIIASDAEADPTIAFGSFTEALRHAYVDLGVDVDIDLSMITPDPVTGLSKAHCAIGRIRYPECPGRPSFLIYMKNSLTGNEPAPVLNYKRTSAAFPHESTADQFFDDTQFESYRALGDHIAEETLGRWLLDDQIRTILNLPRVERPRVECLIDFPLANIDRAWDDLLIYHSPFRAADSEGEFRELTSKLAELEKLVVDTPGLVPYYRECMGLPKHLPAGIEPLDPVNLIVMQIQLMEDVYFSLRLDQYANARDNRGWMNLFRRWAASQTFRDHFKELQTVYSSDFVAFYCNYIEGWGPIDQEPLPHAWDVLYAPDEKDPRLHEAGMTAEPEPVAPSHSGRSASITSTRDARAAGTSDASTAATTRIMAAAAIGSALGMRTSSM
jgi:hypothetical protein